MIALLLAFSVMPVSAASIRVYDKGDMLTDGERAQLEELLADASEKTGVEFIVITSNEGSYYDQTDFCDGDYVVFVIEYDEYDEKYYYFLDTYGSAHNLIKDAEVDRILDYKGVYESIKSGDTFEGVEKIVPPTVKAIEGQLKPPVASVLIPCMIVALAIALTVCIVIIARYKRKLKSAIYPIEQFTSHKLIVSRDNFAGSFVTRTRRSSSSGSSRGRSGGGFSGGGGGGRRGGR